MAVRARAQVDRAGTVGGGAVVTLKVIVRPPTASKSVVVVPVKLMEFAVKPDAANDPSIKLPEANVTPVIGEPVKLVRLIVNDPDTATVLPKKVKDTCVAVTDTLPNMPEALHPSPSMQIAGPVLPTVKGPGAGAPVIGTVPVALDVALYVPVRSAIVFIAQMSKRIAMDMTRNP
jgi:hypothetical protein